MNASLLTTVRARMLAISEAAAFAILLGGVRIADASTCASTQQAASGLQNPLCVNSVTQFVQMVLQAFVEISIPILSFFIIWAGFKFVLARGNPGELGKARENFKWLILGAILILAAWALAQLIGNTVDQIATQ